MGHGGDLRGGALQPQALIVAGPTCSGKSVLAIALAERLGGTVINSDSMQVYAELRIVTARPSAADEARVPHRLYGVRPAAVPGDVAWWRGAALDAMQAAPGLPILCGGTGLYLAALIQGLADIPQPESWARLEARGLLMEIGASGLHARLASADAQTAAGLRPTDGQRVARAWEVWRSTGRGLVAWQQATQRPAPWRFKAILVDPPRDDLRTAIGMRFQSMVAAGAVTEVQALLALGLDPGLPAMRALGVPELSAHLRGETSLEAAIAGASLATGQYIKRQATWFRRRKFVAEDATHTIHARIAGLEQLSQTERADLITFSRTTG